MYCFLWILKFLPSTFATKWPQTLSIALNISDTMRIRDTHTVSSKYKWIGIEEICRIKNNCWGCGLKFPFKNQNFRFVYSSNFGNPFCLPLATTSIVYIPTLRNTLKTTIFKYFSGYFETVITQREPVRCSKNKYWPLESCLLLVNNFCLEIKKKTPHPLPICYRISLISHI